MENVEEKVILAVEFDDNKRIQIRINTTNEALLALALRKAGQCVDFYLEELELKKQQESLVKPASSLILDKIRG
jgi:hypothetical protein